MIKIMRKIRIDFSKTYEAPSADYYFKLLIRRAVEATLDYEGMELDAFVSVTLTNNEYIHKLNKKFRGVDRPTDVLSFPMYERDELSSLENGDTVELGDIVISLERAYLQSREIGNTFLEEVVFLTVHSMLHLLGYDHERSKEDDEEQCRRQKEIVSAIEI
jgi:probable rRNA maturation factor